MAEKIVWQKAFAEFVAMTMFIFVSCGAATGVANKAGWVLQVALTFGLAIASLAYAVGVHSGGQINCAVTFGLVISGNLALPQAGANFAAQLVGAIVGDELVALVHDAAHDETGNLAANVLGEGITPFAALVAEIFGTFLLMYVILETAVNPRTAANRALAPLAIGLAVFLAHSALIPVDGCSINPTRSFGAAVAATVRFSGDSAKMAAIWGPMWVFILGPLAGAALAVGTYKLVNTPVVDTAGKKLTDVEEADSDSE